MFDVVGKVALVTGGASGIGLAIIEELLENDLKGVTIVDINEENGKNAVNKLTKKYGSEKVLFVKIDVADRNQVKNVFELAVKTFRNLDIVINCAAIVKDLVWEEEFAVNLGGTASSTYFALEHYLPKHKSESEGIIINMSSVTGLDVYEFTPMYSATKSGIIMLSRCYGSQMHYNRNKVKVIAVCPGYTDTTIHEVHPDTLLNPAFMDIRSQELHELIKQPASHVARGVVKIIQNSESGSVWVIENLEPPYKIKFFSREESKISEVSV